MSWIRKFIRRPWILGHHSSFIRCLDAAEQTNSKRSPGHNSPSLHYAPHLAAPITGMIIALNIGDRLIEEPATPLPISTLKS